MTVLMHTYTSSNNRLTFDKHGVAEENTVLFKININSDNISKYLDFDLENIPQTCPVARYLASHITEDYKVFVRCSVIVLEKEDETTKIVYVIKSPSDVLEWIREFDEAYRTAQLPKKYIEILMRDLTVKIKLPKIVLRSTE